jgi:type IV pilus assembly protein PilM
LAGIDETAAPVLVVNAGTGSVTTAIVQGERLLLHRSVDMSAEVSGSASAPVLPLVDRESTAQEWAQQEGRDQEGRYQEGRYQEGLGPGGWDRFDAEAAMQTSVVETAVVRERVSERRLGSAAREVAQAVSVAAAYFEDSLQRSPDQLLVAGTLGAESLAAMMEESGVEGLRVREMVDSSMMEAGAVTASVPRSWLAGVRGALRN